MYFIILLIIYLCAHCIVYHQRRYWHGSNKTCAIIPAELRFIIQKPKQYRINIKNIRYPLGYNYHISNIYVLGTKMIIFEQSGYLYTNGFIVYTRYK